MNTRRVARRAVAVAVYFAALTLGSGLFVVDPARPLLAVPVVAGAVLLGHAMKTRNLDDAGRAAMWLWAAVLVLLVAGALVDGVLSRWITLPAVEDDVGRVLGTLGLTAVFVAAYARRV